MDNNNSSVLGSLTPDQKSLVQRMKAFVIADLGYNGRDVTYWNILRYCRVVGFKEKNTKKLLIGWVQLKKEIEEK